MKATDINKVIIHCAATPEGKHFDVKDIYKWHVIERGWRDVGYHYIILLDGTIQKGRNDNETGAHCLGQNGNSLGVCYIGGVDSKGNPKDTRTPEQNGALKALIFMLKLEYPGIHIHGHNEFSTKACPSFDVQKENWL